MKPLAGTPYKYNKTIRTHTKFVQDVQYAPSGDVFVSVGSDFKVFLYDGKTGEMTVDLGEKLHSGTIVSSRRLVPAATKPLSMLQVGIKIANALPPLRLTRQSRSVSERRRCS